MRGVSVLDIAFESRLDILLRERRRRDERLKNRNYCLEIERAGTLRR
jgi:hypothetical protein